MCLLACVFVCVRVFLYGSVCTCDSVRVHVYSHKHVCAIKYVICNVCIYVWCVVCGAHTVQVESPQVAFTSVTPLQGPTTGFAVVIEGSFPPAGQYLVGLARQGDQTRTARANGTCADTTVKLTCDVLPFSFDAFAQEGSHVVVDLMYAQSSAGSFKLLDEERRAFTVYSACLCECVCASVCVVLYCVVVCGCVLCKGCLRSRTPFTVCDVMVVVACVDVWSCH